MTDVQAHNAELKRQVIGFFRLASAAFALVGLCATLTLLWLQPGRLALGTYSLTMAFLAAASVYDLMHQMLNIESAENVQPPWLWVAYSWRLLKYGSLPTIIVVSGCLRHFVMQPVITLPLTLLQVALLLFAWRVFRARQYYRRLQLPPGWA